MGFNRRELTARAKNYWAGLDESQRTARRWALGALAVAVLAAPAWFFGRPWWQRWQRARALEQVTVFAQRDDYRNATLALKRAMALGPDDPETWQEAAKVLGEIGSPEVLVAREQLTRLVPGDVALRLALAREALRFDRLDLAQQTLQAIADESRRDEAFFRLAAALALALGRTAELEDNLEKLAAARPGDPMAKFGLAAVQLWSDSGAAQETARRQLEALLAAPTVRVRAALELLKDATRQGSDRRTTAVMTQLLRRFVPEWPADLPSTSFSAWLQLVEKLKAVAAADGPGEAAALARWLADTGQPRESLVWLESLPGAESGDLAVRDMRAQLSAELGDLDRLEDLLRGKAWGDWPRAALTLAIASRLQRLRSNESHARATWEDAVDAAGNSEAALRALARLAEAWQEPGAQEQALQAATQRLPGGTWAFEALETIYGARRDLPRLWTLYDAWQKRRPGDDRLASKWILIGCILGRAGPEAFARAEKLGAAGKSEVPARLALAAVRWRQKRARETLDLIASLPADAEAEPAVRFWRLLANAEIGNKELVLKELGSVLRPELSDAERELVRAAASKAGAGPSDD
ncbi:MAG TPA: hypothetical protein VHE13_12330 [Opitutus sp.]|nr:hypothetical protein [Opitutus sp.]